MSKNADIIALKPMKGADLMSKVQDAKDPETPIVSCYIPPSKRQATAKVEVAPTAEQLISEQSFPSLPIGTVMTKNVSWGQLRARLSSPKEQQPKEQQPKEQPNDQPAESPKDTSMKQQIEQSLKKMEEDEEEAQKNDAITDPFMMSKEKLKIEGWQILNMNPKYRRAWLEKYNINEAEYTEKPYAWPSPIMSFSANKIQSLIQPFYADGRPITFASKNNLYSL